MRKLVSFMLCCLFMQVHLFAQDPELSSWTIADGTEARYYVEGNTTPQSLGGLVNIKYVKYDADHVYINASGLPAYIVGPFPDGNPSLPGDVDYIFKIPRNPVEETGTKTATTLGQIGVFINGVPIYNPLDAMSYESEGVWNRDAQLNEADGFDCNRGHPAPNMSDLNSSYYHHHQIPIRFSESPSPISNICDTYPTEALFTVDNTQHSPLIGYAFDGFPVYGPYGYSDPNDAASPIRLIKSSYTLRNITQRHTLPDGTVLDPSLYGPDVDATYPLGTYIEDYEYNAANGDLDEYNGRWTKTPEYPDGIYAYFATVDDDFNSAYPYTIGPSYYGVVVQDNLTGGATSVTVPAGVTTYAEYVAVTSSDIINVSPASATEGTTSVSVSFEFDPALTGPADNYSAVPNSVTLGGVSGTSVSRNSASGVVTATFDVSTLATGTYDIVAIFTPPSLPSITYTGTSVFEITGTVTSSDIINVTPNSGNTSVTLNFDFADAATGPADDFNIKPDQVTLGGVTGTSVSRNSTSGTVTATFDLSGLSAGLYDIVATFNPPMGSPFVYTGASVFEVTGGSGGTGSTGEMPQLEFWKYNKEGVFYTNTSSEQILVDVAHVHYTSELFYVSSSGVPSYYMDNTSKYNAADQSWVHHFPMTPEENTGTKTDRTVKLGLYIDGTIALDPGDGQSYENEGVWNQLAYEFEGLDFDYTNGHSTAQNVYHHHVAHNALYAFDDTKHSGIIGYAFDGFPVYGPFGYSDPADSTSGIARMTSSYQKRNITDRTTLPDGTVLDPSLYGPDLSTQFLGKYKEDYEYVNGSGTLDAYNGRFSVTPEYPEGTYAYFVTVDASNNPVYPYIVGDQFYGNVEMGNFGPSGGSTTIPGTAVEYINITASPADIQTIEGMDAQFVGGFNGTPYGFQWYVSGNGGSNWTPVTNGGGYSGATNDTLTISPVSSAMFNNLYRLIITGDNASDTSMAALLDGGVVTIGKPSANSHEVRIYPNPSTGTFKITISGATENHTIRMTDVLGNLVLEKESSGDQVSVEAADLEPGMYYITIENSSGLVNTQPLLITR